MAIKTTGCLGCETRLSRSRRNSNRTCSRKSGFSHPSHSPDRRVGPAVSTIVAALLTPRPPDLMVLNEPENSLHPDLIGALSRLITLAAENSQVITVSHNTALVDELEADEICVPIRLEKVAGETRLQDADLLSQYGWKWPTR